MDYYKFFRNESKDDLGRYFARIQHMSKFELEVNHTYIQRAFPLQEVSVHDRRAKAITDEEIEAIKKDRIAMGNIIFMVSVMEDFFGLPYTGKKPRFFKKGNHNYLRVTRILKFLKMMDMTEEYERFKSEIRTLCDSFPEEVTKENLLHWEI